MFISSLTAFDLDAVEPTAAAIASHLGMHSSCEAHISITVIRHACEAGGERECV